MRAKRDDTYSSDCQLEASVGEPVAVAVATEGVGPLAAIVEALYRRQSQVARVLDHLSGEEVAPQDARERLTSLGHFPDYAPELDWNASAVIGHLTESAHVFTGRIKAVRARPGIVIPDFDPYRNVPEWAERPVEHLARPLRIAHRELLAAVESLDEQALSIPAVWDDGTALTLGTMVDFLPGHVGDHAAQLEAMNRPRLTNVRSSLYGHGDI